MTMRGENKNGPDTYIHNMTDGMMFNIIAKDPLLSEYDYVLVDEVHERSINIDTLLLYLRTVSFFLSPQPPQIRI